MSNTTDNIFSAWCSLSPEPHDIPGFQGVFFSSGLHLSCDGNSYRRSSNQGSPQRHWSQSKHKMSKRSSSILLFILSVRSVPLCVCTAELQAAARPWCFPVSQWPSEPCQTSAVFWVRCRALGACVCPVCTQNLKRKNTSHFHLMNVNVTFMSVYDGQVNAFVFSALVLTHSGSCRLKGDLKNIPNGNTSSSKKLAKGGISGSVVSDFKK